LLLHDAECCEALDFCQRAERSSSFRGDLLYGDKNASGGENAALRDNYRIEKHASCSELIVTVPLAGLHTSAEASSQHLAMTADGGHHVEHWVNGGSLSE
jgi:hypothetical protein